MYLVRANIHIHTTQLGVDVGRAPISITLIDAACHGSSGPPNADPTLNVLVHDRAKQKRYC